MTPDNCIVCGRFAKNGGRLCGRCLHGARRAFREPWWMRLVRWLLGAV